MGDYCGIVRKKSFGKLKDSQTLCQQCIVLTDPRLICYSKIVRFGDSCSDFIKTTNQAERKVRQLENKRKR